MNDPEDYDMLDDAEGWEACLADDGFWEGRTRADYESSKDNDENEPDDSGFWKGEYQ